VAGLRPHGRPSTVKSGGEWRVPRENEEPGSRPGRDQFRPASTKAKRDFIARTPRDGAEFSLRKPTRSQERKRKGVGLLRSK
jgi:hypothetical protein